MGFRSSWRPCACVHRSPQKQGLSRQHIWPRLDKCVSGVNLRHAGQGTLRAPYLQLPLDSKSQQSFVPQADITGARICKTSGSRCAQASAVETRRKSGFSLSCCLLWAYEHFLPRMHLPSRKNLHIALVRGFPMPCEQQRIWARHRFFQQVL